MPVEIIEKSNFIDLDKVEMSKIMGVVHILEGVSITKNKNQSDLLGDFFESIIENEFKQSKGQFFTHKNIVRYITVIFQSHPYKNRSPFPITSPRYAPYYRTSSPLITVLKALPWQMKSTFIIP
ncbi:MAG: hypothetical protein ACLSHX_12635 [Suilimivivens sp.]